MIGAMLARRANISRNHAITTISVHEQYASGIGKFAHQSELPDRNPAMQTK